PRDGPGGEGAGDVERMSRYVQQLDALRPAAVGGAAEGGEEIVLALEDRLTFRDHFAPENEPMGETVPQGMGYGEAGQRTAELRDGGIHRRIAGIGLGARPAAAGIGGVRRELRDSLSGEDVVAERGRVVPTATELPPGKPHVQRGRQGRQCGQKEGASYGVSNVVASSPHSFAVVVVVACEVLDGARPPARRDAVALL